MYRGRTWKLEEAVELCARLSVALSTAGYAVGLTGSVLIHGKSRKDLDLIIYPLTTQTQRTRWTLHETLVRFGMDIRVPKEQVHEAWRNSGSKDTKHVEVWDYCGRRVDLFFLR